MAIKIPFERGRIIALNPTTKPIKMAIMAFVESVGYSRSQNAKGIDKCPVIRIVAHAGPSSARRGAKSNSQLEQF